MDGWINVRNDWSLVLKDGNKVELLLFFRTTPLFILMNDTWDMLGKVGPVVHYSVLKRLRCKLEPEGTDIGAQ